MADHYEREGYLVRIDPDGTDYFDLVVRRGDEVGLVEAKVANSRAVLTQALKRRAWGAWGAVALSGERSARHLVARTEGTRAAVIGVGWAAPDGYRVLRPARPWVAPGEPDLFADLRRRFRAVLDAIDRGEIPGGVPWDGLLGEIRRASGGRGFGEWRLEELDRDGR